MTIYKCHYGCGRDAIKQNKSGNWMCENSHTKCPENRKKNSEGGKKSYSSGKRLDAKTRYQNFSEETKAKVAWSSGLTKETDERVRRNGLSVSSSTKGRPGTPLTKETKKKLSEKRIHFLENNSKWCDWYEVGGIKVQGKLEKSFAEFLLYHNIYFERIRIKYLDHRIYTPDFFIPDMNLYIEVKGFLFERDKSKMKSVLNENDIDLRLAFKEDIKDLIEGKIILTDLKMVKNILHETVINYNLFENHWGC